MAARRLFVLGAVLLGSSTGSIAETITYKYDAQGQLIRTCTARWNEAQVTGYSLDKAGNRSQLSNVRTDRALAPGQGIYSTDGRFLLWMQSDNNLVVYGNFGSGWTPLGWSTNTVGSGAAKAYFQSDGNLVLYTDSGVPVWHSNTAAYPCSSINVQNDGNVVIRDANGLAVWSTNTGGH